MNKIPLKNYIIKFAVEGLWFHVYKVPVLNIDLSNVETDWNSYKKELSEELNIYADLLPNIREKDGVMEFYFGDLEELKKNCKIVDKSNKSIYCST